MSIYIITNPEKKTSTPFNDIALKKMISKVGYRNKRDRDYFIKIWEQLENRKWTEEELKLL